LPDLFTPTQSAGFYPLRAFPPVDNLRQIGPQLMLNVMVTGASRGFGLAIARKLANSGYRVIAIARQEGQELGSAIREMRERGGPGVIEFRPIDLSQLHEIPGLVKTLRKDFGSIYGLVNNAGIGTNGALANMPDTQIESLILLNTVSPIMLTKYVVRTMMADGCGRIVNISSIVSFTGFTGLSVYSASKASLIGFTRSLAREVGRFGINVNAVAPGFVETSMTEQMTGDQHEQIVRRSPLRRLAEVEDIANTVEFLLDQKSRNITGTVLTVDAGSTA
jgi:3-oxoacyl-[acyl-carrier protein] reductase